MYPSRIDGQKIHIPVFLCMLLLLWCPVRGYGADGFSVELAGKPSASSYSQDVDSPAEHAGFMKLLLDRRENASPGTLQASALHTAVAWQSGLVVCLLICIACLAGNIARRRRTETALLNSEDILKTTLATMDKYVFVVDTQGVLLTCHQPPDSPLIEGSSQVMLNRSYKEVMSEDLVRIIDGILEGACSGGLEESAYHLDTPQGKRFYHADISVRKDAGNGQDLYIIISTDVTRNREAEEALLRSEAKYRFLTEKMNDMIWTLDLNFKTTYVSPSVEKVLGFTVEERLRQEASEMLTPQSLADAVEVLAGELEYDQDEGVDPDRSIIFEAEYYHKDGSTVWTENVMSAIRDENGRIVGIHGVSRDITMSRKMESQLRQAQKMEALGTLAGGIAHDFNNILSAIIGFTELAQNYAAQGSKIQKNLQEVLRAGMRARDLVKQILTFSRQVEGERIPVQVHLIVNEALKLLRSTIPATIEIREHVDKKSGMVLADPTQIHQVIMNLCTNAYQAIDGHGGILDVRLERTEKDSTVIPGQVNRYVRLSVSDTGAGIERGTLERIFDPFFTTKDKGKGTGLGLATVHGIVTSLGGSVDVESAPGVGTTFMVDLPCIEHRVHREAVVVNDASKGQGERILLVDDEEPLVQIEKEMLEDLGYTVIPKTDSMDALDTFRAQSDLFDLIITDMTMPNLTGVDLSRMVLQIKPDTPIILCTGFSDKVNKERALELGIREYLEKPFNKDAFALAVNRVLNSGP